MKIPQPKFNEARFLHDIHPDVERAFIMCVDRHKKQVRKYTNEPYAYHPIEVAQLAISQRLGDSTEQLRRIAVASLLHDTIEDTDATYTDIRKAFGDEAAHDVYYLSEPVSKEKGNRDTRHMMTRHLLSRAPLVIQGIKVCDMCVNMRSIGEHDPQFAVPYAKEKAMTVQALDSQALQMFPEASDRLQFYIKEILDGK